ncbi:Haloacid dehalogenase domain protein hydrolase [Rippkaea orientalis PCC 8801]|uniref:Haloacid dehalogenase domain protein hydrolase n=1 Tax=Rippkaea orientalis (strain PCC 8801 / RF-1) TaxID=41431 RepID=B7JV33_RIPO1|nr:HAD hydrolase-like protein [Rippkaea orientalis]ACK66885.1 Haloacid dehalogenase domain protein hydrolase [Rippkaea orientalis PCC 8801]
MTVKVIVFDFDGTLADTYETFVEIANSLSGEFGYKPINLEEQQKLKHLSARDIIKQSEIPPLKIPFILRRVKSELNNKIHHLKPISNIPSSLKQLKERGYLLGIITSNIQENVKDFLDNNGLTNLFDFVYSGTALFGKDKVINKLLKERKLRNTEVIYVGDETRDIQSAKKSQVSVIAVAWGFNSPEILAEYQPDFLIYHPEELIEVIENCQESFTQVL